MPLKNSRAATQSIRPRTRVCDLQQCSIHPNMIQNRSSNCFTQLSGTIGMPNSTPVQPLTLPSIPLTLPPCFPRHRTRASVKLWPCFPGPMSMLPLDRTVNLKRNSKFPLLSLTVESRPRQACRTRSLESPTAVLHIHDIRFFVFSFFMLEACENPGVRDHGSCLAVPSFKLLLCSGLVAAFPYKLSAKLHSAKKTQIPVWFVGKRIATISNIMHNRRSTGLVHA